MKNYIGENSENDKLQRKTLKEIDRILMANKGLDIYGVLQKIDIPNAFFADKNFLMKLAEKLGPSSVLEVMPKNLRKDNILLQDLAKAYGANFVLSIYSNSPNVKKSLKTFQKDPEIVIYAIQRCSNDVDLSLKIYNTIEQKSRKMLKKYPEITRMYVAQLQKIGAFAINNKNEKIEDPQPSIAVSSKNPASHRGMKEKSNEVENPTSELGK